MAEQIDPHTWAAAKPSGVARWVPILRWFPGYDRGWLRSDIIAGATIWGLLVPEMIAYAGLAGLPPQAGLYTLLVAPVAYAVLGTSRHLVAAGTSAAAVLLASGVADLSPSGAVDYATKGAALVLLCGGVFLVAGVLRLGFVAQFLSRPVMEGFVFGLAIFVTVKQLPKLFGIDGGDGDSIQQFVHMLTHLGDTSGVTLCIGVAALAVLFGTERYAPRVPGGLLVLGLGIAISAGFDLAEHGVDVVGNVPSGLPSVGIPDIAGNELAGLLATAAGMALVIFSESLGAAENFARKHGYQIDPNQEMVALGVGNISSGLVGGLAAGGSLSQTAVNEGAGARSEISPLVATLLSLVTVLALTPLFTDLPEAVLAALIIHAMSHLWKIAEFRRYRALRPVEFWLGLLTLAGVITLDVLPGLVIGVVSMLLLVVYRASRPHIDPLGLVAGTEGVFLNLDRHPDAQSVPGVLILRVDSPVFYANASLVLDRVKQLAGSADPLPSAVILEVGASDQLDVTSADTLDELATTLHAAGIDFALADMHRPAFEMARRSGLIDTVGDDRIFRTVEEALARLRPTRDPGEDS